MAASPAELADTAAEAIRALNHATLPGTTSLTYPGDAYSTIGNLTLLGQRLPQALGQVLIFLNRLEADGHLCTDDSRSLSAVLGDLHIAIGDARAAANELANALSRAHSALSRLAYQD